MQKQPFCRVPTYCPSSRSCWDPGSTSEKPTIFSPWKKLPEAHHLLPLLGIIALEDPLVREQVTALGTHGHLVCKFNFLRRDLSPRWMSIAIPYRVWKTLKKYAETLVEYWICSFLGGECQGPFNVALGLVVGKVAHTMDPLSSCIVVT